jgi:hypothetical protein
MKRFLLAAGAVGAMLLTASPAAAQRYSRGHTSFSVTIGNGYGYSPYGYGYSPYGYDPYSYRYSPYSYGYAYPSAYYSSYYPNQGYYYSRSYRDSRRRHHRHHRRYVRYDRYDGW